MGYVLRYFSRKIKAHHLDAYAAQAAFFLLLSAVPLLMLVFGLFRLFPLPAEEFPKGWGGFFPGDTALLLEEALAKVPGTGESLLASFSAVTVLWSASKSVYYLMGGLNSVFEVKEKRSYLRVRLLAVVYTVALILAIVGALVLMVFGGSLAETAAECLPHSEKWMKGLSSFRFFIGLLLLTGIFATVYAVLPDRKASLASQLPGALLASAGWMLFSMLFSLYVEHFADYTGLYGSLSAIVIFMLWLYVCMYILLMGGEINLLTGRIRRL